VSIALLRLRISSIDTRGQRWKWGGGHPSGKVDEIVEEGKAQVTSNKVRDSKLRLRRWVADVMRPDGRAQGNTVSRNARDGDPAVKIKRDGVSSVRLK